MEKYKDLLKGDVKEANKTWCQVNLYRWCKWRRESGVHQWKEVKRMTMKGKENKLLIKFPKLKKKLPCCKQEDLSESEFHLYIFNQILKIK